jgi:hypothetical protein
MFQLLTNPPSSDWRVPERSILRRKVANIGQLAQQAINHLRPELLLLAGKAAEGTATESGKQIVTWFRERLKGNAAEAALDDAVAYPENDRRIQALQTQIEILIEENESFRDGLQALLGGSQKSASAPQNAAALGADNKIAQASGHDISIRIR